MLGYATLRVDGVDGLLDFELDSELCACRIDRPAGHTDGLTTCMHALITFGWPVLPWVRAV